MFFSTLFIYFFFFVILLLQDDHVSSEENENFDWNTDDDLEIENYSSSCSTLVTTTRNTQAIISNGEVFSYANYRFICLILSCFYNFCY